METMTITITKRQFKLLPMKEQMRIRAMQMAMWKETEEYKNYKANRTPETIQIAGAKRREIVW